VWKLLVSAAVGAGCGGGGGAEEEEEEEELELELEDALEEDRPMGLALCRSSMSVTSCTKEALQ